MENEKYKMSVEMEAKEEANWQLQQKLEQVSGELDRVRKALQHEQTRHREKN